MKVLDLCCSQQHRFEGWFASDDELASQEERGLLSCPLCGDKTITRLPSAPRLNVAHLRDAPSEANGPSVMQSQWMRAVRHVLAHTEDVGDRFPEEARRIHYGETEHRGIRGKATPQDTEALREEGIEVMALPLPDALKEPLQ